VLPGASQQLTLPFISEIGPLRRILATFVTLPGGGDGGLRAFSYEVEQGTGSPPTSFGTRKVSELLPMVMPDFLLSPGNDPNRPIYGWFVQGSLEGADVASAGFRGQHNCAGQCSGDGSSCSDDDDCPQAFCANLECDTLEWHVAWQPWDAERTFQLPVIPSNVSPLNFWAPSWQDEFEPNAFAWLDFDYLDGWREALHQGRDLFPFGSDRDFLNEVVPPEARLRMSFIGGD
jgi:hypothetical protein